MDENGIGVNSPQFPSGLTWLNSPPLTMKSLLGKIVMVDFWTYSCINCQRTLPYLKKWWEKYSKSGFVLIGVHTPEFEFEKDEKNVKEALEKYQVDWPTVLDNDYQIWDSYANKSWPAKYLIDHQGKVIFSHFGEGNYIETEVKIQEALRDAGFKIDSQLVSGVDREVGALWKTLTPELYFGSLRGKVINIPQDISIQPDTIYTIGKWNQEKEYLEHGRETEDLKDLIILNYRAKEVFLVMSSEDGSPVKVYLTLDGVGLNSDNAGKDVLFDDEERSYIEVTFSTLYNLISTKTFGDHILRLSAISDKLQLYAFTFGS